MRALPPRARAYECVDWYRHVELPRRLARRAQYVREYQADGFLINYSKCCNSLSDGQLLILREVEQRTGIAGGFVESDLVDPRYFSGANIKTRMESYFQMIEQKRKGAA